MLWLLISIHKLRFLLKTIRYHFSTAKLELKFWGIIKWFETKFPTKSNKCFKMVVFKTPMTLLSHLDDWCNISNLSLMSRPDWRDYINCHLINITTIENYLSIILLKEKYY